MRFTEQEEPSPDLLSIYDNIMKKDENILNDLFYKYNNQLITIESYTIPNNNSERKGGRRKYSGRKTKHNKRHNKRHTKRHTRK